jgi:hypothetical protein
MKNIQEFSPYLRENTMYLRDKNQFFNAVLGNNVILFWETVLPVEFHGVDILYFEQ